MEKKIVEVATFLVNVQTVNGVAETMNRIAVLIDGYSGKVSKYFRGLYTHIDSNDRVFQPLNDYDSWRVKRLGAMLILSPTMNDAVDTFIRLHNMLKWEEGRGIMIELTNRLYDVADNME